MQDRKFKNILCCLDLTDTDSKILLFARMLQDSGIIQNLKLLHVIKNDIKEKIVQYGTHELWIEHKKDIENQISIEAKKVLQNDSPFEVIVKGGSPLEVINTKSKSEDSELVIVGKKNKTEGTGIASKHIARSCLNDIVFVSDDWNGAISSTLMAYDFSEHAETTLSVAKSVSDQLGVKSFNILHIIPSPSGYFKAGRLHLDFLESEKRASLKTWEKEVELHPEYSDMTFDVLENERNNVAHYLFIKSQELDSPIVFAGSKGKTASSVFLLGSVTERLLQSQCKGPIWIHKIKGENFDLFDAFFKGD